MNLQSRRMEVIFPSSLFFSSSTSTSVSDNEAVEKEDK